MAVADVKRLFARCPLLVSLVLFAARPALIIKAAYQSSLRKLEQQERLIN
jgi:hypothetical protein